MQLERSVCNSLLLQLRPEHIAVDPAKEKELKFSTWETFATVQKHGRVLEVREPGLADGRRGAPVGGWRGG